jgi:hypothetical protein
MRSAISYKTIVKSAYIHLFPLIFLFQQVYSQSAASGNIIAAIKNTDLKYLNQVLHVANVDTVLDNNGSTPLWTAIDEENATVAHFLLKLNANPNRSVNDISPLMKATANRKTKILRLLLKYGAHLNTRNKKGLTAYDYAVSEGNNSAAHFLEHYFEMHLPNYSDGPYIWYKSKHEIEVQYLKYDSLRRKYFQLSSVFDLKPTNYKFRGFIGDTSAYDIPRNFSRPPSVYKNVEKLIVIGDIHGQCDSLKKFLIANKITDPNFSWNYGNGHLVFLGDIFDRGEQVTEALWLIYKLEKESEKHGGRVHLLLGNHELMAMEGDERYLSKKYHCLFKYSHSGNKKNYSSKTILGKWLRSKNTLEIINDILFVHGGIHPEITKYNITVDSVNALINSYLNAKPGKRPDNSLIEFVLSEKGPFWYRGMINNGELTQSLVDSITSYFNVSKIMMGHTYLPRITSFFDKKIYGLDVPFYLHTGVPMQALSIYKGQFKLLNTAGTFDETK